MLRNMLKPVVWLVGLLLSLTAFALPISELFHKTKDPVIGNPKGKITMVEFFDYQCSHCINMAPVIEMIKQTNPDVRIVFKDFPIRGPLSEFAARAALAANYQHKYYVFSHALLHSHTALTENEVFTIAKRVGLNTDKLKKDMNSPATTRQLNANIRLALQLNLNGTPAFYFAKTKDGSQANFVLGEMTQSEMQAVIDKLKG